jgi:hypothetical protein
MASGVDALIGVDNWTTVPLQERHCGRCQGAFPGDPTQFFQTDWALCPACQAILLPRRPAAPASTPSLRSIAPAAPLATGQLSPLGGAGFDVVTPVHS